MRQVLAHDVLFLSPDECFEGGRNLVQLRWMSCALRFAKLVGRRVVLVLSALPPLAGSERDIALRMAKQADLLTVTNGTVEAALRVAGLTRHIEVLCDPLFAMGGNFVPTPTTAATGRPVVGLAPVDFYAHPIRARLHGHFALKAGWPAYTDWHPQRARQTAELEQAWADFAQHLVKARGFEVRLLPTCELSQATCQRIYERLPVDVRYFSKVLGSGTCLQETLPELPGLKFMVSSSLALSSFALAASVSNAALASGCAFETMLRDSGLEDRLIEQWEPGATALQLERLFHSVTFDEGRHRTVQAEFLLDTLAPTCDRFSVVLEEWWRSPAIFKS
jgi:hypothetical protein